jgi:hypothetical protein
MTLKKSLMTCSLRILLKTSLRRKRSFSLSKIGRILGKIMKKLLSRKWKYKGLRRKMRMKKERLGLETKTS